MSTIILIAACAGGGVLAILLGVSIWCCIRRRRRLRRSPAAEAFVSGGEVRRKQMTNSHETLVNERSDPFTSPFAPQHGRNSPYKPPQHQLMMEVPPHARVPLSVNTKVTQMQRNASSPFITRQLAGPNIPAINIVNALGPQNRDHLSIIPDSQPQPLLVAPPSSVVTRSGSGSSRRPNSPPPPSSPPAPNMPLPPPPTRLNHIPGTLSVTSASPAPPELPRRSSRRVYAPRIIQRKQSVVDQSRRDSIGSASVYSSGSAPWDLHDEILASHEQTFAAAGQRLALGSAPATTTQFSVNCSKQTPCDDDEGIASSDEEGPVSPLARLPSKKR
jgi:hypothetical protein